MVGAQPPTRLGVRGDGEFVATCARTLLPAVPWACDGRRVGWSVLLIAPFHSQSALSLALLVGCRAMGLSLSSLFTSLSSLVRWSKDQDVRILMLGLDAAGKVRGHMLHGGELFD